MIKTEQPKQAGSDADAGCFHAVDARMQKAGFELAPHMRITVLICRWMEYSG
jgi:hypothetical protein